MSSNFLRKLFKQLPAVKPPANENELMEIDQLFRRRLERNASTPPDVWAKIESQLSPHSWLDKHIWRLSLVCCSLLIISMTYYCFYQTKQQSLSKQLVALEGSSLSSVKPLNRLPIEGLAYIIPPLPLPKPNHETIASETELTIMIPLQIVDSEAEIEHLLQMYEENVRSKIRP